ncbi:hypothetical protein [Actinoplanes sp. NPDC049265]|uniref:hypothetical protein n=1 Tax=Actinoplanes sp. NPDC049265 TaxID=3363902 RepID=UPI00371047FF
MRAPFLILGAAALVALPAPAHAASSCTFTALQPPSGSRQASVTHASRTGVYAGTAYTDGGSSSAARWENGVARALGSFEVFDVNADGTVVGQIESATPILNRRTGKWQPLPRPDGTTAAATAVNDAGEVFGALDDGRLIRWPAAQPGTYELIDSPLPGAGTAVDVTADGTLLARGGKSGAALRAPDGTWTVLDRPAPDQEITAVAVAGDRVVGHDWGGTGIEWDRSGAIVRTWPGFTPADVNAAGQVLGRQDALDRTAIFKDDTLETALPASDDDWRYFPVALDNDGTALVRAISSRFPAESMLARC